jgi:hypothetical protein
MQAVAVADSKSESEQWKIGASLWPGAATRAHNIARRCAAAAIAMPRACADGISHVEPCSFAVTTTLTMTMTMTMTT